MKLKPRKLSIIYPRRANKVKKINYLTLLYPDEMIVLIKDLIKDHTS